MVIICGSRQEEEDDRNLCVKIGKEEEEEMMIAMRQVEKGKAREGRERELSICRDAVGSWVSISRSFRKILNAPMKEYVIDRPTG